MYCLRLQGPSSSLPPLDIIWSNPLLKESHSKPRGYDHIQMTPDHLLEERLHNISGQPMPMLGHPINKTQLPDVQSEPLVFQCAPVASCPVTGHHGERPSSSLCTLPSHTLGKIPQPSSSPGWTALLPQPFLMEEMFQSLHHLHGPLLASPVAPCPPRTGEPRTGLSTPGAASPVLSKGEGSPPSTCRQCVD